MMAPTRLVLCVVLLCAVTPRQRTDAQTRELGRASPAATTVVGRGLLGPSVLRIDSLELAIRSTRAWRGLDLGSSVPSATLHLALWEIDGKQDRHAVLLRASAATPVANRASIERADVVEVGAAYRFKLDTEQGELNVGATRRHFGVEGPDRTGNEWFASLQRRVPASWTELRPLLGVLVARDLDVFDATYVEPRVTLDFGAQHGDNGASSLIGRLDVGTAWSDYARRRSPSDPSFGYHGSMIGLRVGKDWGQSFAGPLSLEVGVERWWSRASIEPLPVAVFGVRVVAK